jgi:hypothetical protein
VAPMDSAYETGWGSRTAVDSVHVGWTACMHCEPEAHPLPTGKSQALPYNTSLPFPCESPRVALCSVSPRCAQHSSRLVVRGAKASESNRAAGLNPSSGPPAARIVQRSQEMSLTTSLAALRCSASRARRSRYKLIYCASALRTQPNNAVNAPK